MKALSIPALLAFSTFFSATAQDIQQQAPQQNDYYQIFLETPAQKVNKVNYYDDSGPVQFKLSPDGKSIHLLDYKGDGGVKAEVVSMDGTVEEVVRSKCKIHSLQEL